MTDTHTSPVTAEREAFIEAHHKHLDLTEISDAWGRPMFKHSHVEALWEGWKTRAARIPAQGQPNPAHLSERQ